MDEKKDALQASFSAIVDYHNGLGQTRFTVAALYLAGTGFLASSFFDPAATPQAKVMLSALGFVLTSLCWLLEIRTYQLLENLSRHGRSIEYLLGIKFGFFALQKKQPLRARLPFLRGIKLPNWACVRFVASHSFALNFLYLITWIFWICALWPTITGLIDSLGIWGQAA